MIIAYTMNIYLENIEKIFPRYYVMVMFIAVQIYHLTVVCLLDWEGAFWYKNNCPPPVKTELAFLNETFFFKLTECEQT